ncbi:ankyrin repeat domain-containing protein [Wolbachia endosymbiont of Ctenocephalides felis wCfeT]|uniref:ankyrin repeat domain-containing protein n=1 Tax=Wolbachia endosymbiont of Ctenocephalides felis wCfeT TaxID=2732593 RepID=UPI00144752B6|nr:ankyrin repeat domain-containing protein [Wolbachia endosymbiont of Ctenocephalides felis wCfeT]
MTIKTEQPKEISYDEATILAEIQVDGINLKSPIVARLIKEGRLWIIEKVIDRGADVNVPDDEGRAPIHWAQYKELVEILIERGADINVGDIEGRTALSLAAESGNQEVCETLLKYGADVNIQDKYGYTPLLFAVKHEHQKLSETLLKYGADVNIRDIYGVTPLHWAALRGEVEIVKSLIKHGANIDIRVNGGKAASDLAREKGHTEIAGFLELGEKTCKLFIAIEEGNFEKIALLIKSGADINAQNKDGNTSLHLAVIRGKDIFTIIKLLMENGANIDIKNSNDKTVSDLVREKGHTEMAELLEFGDKTCKLFLAMQERNSEKIESLIKSGANVDAQNKDGNTLLHWAAMKDAFPIVKLLLENNANIDIKNNDGRTAPDLARETGHAEIAALMELGVKDYYTKLLIEAVKESNAVGAGLAIENGADVNAKEKNSGYTPLKVAVQQGCQEIAELLIKNNADVNAEDNYGWKILHWAGFVA